MEDCIFCKIARGEIPATKVYEDDEIIAFLDIYPKAPKHVLLIPRRHIANMEALAADDAPLVGRLLLRARELAAEEGLTDSGYRLVINNGPDSGQEVFHVHLHLLGGRHLGPMAGFPGEARGA